MRTTPEWNRNTTIAESMTDKITTSWVRNESDRLAIAGDCTFDVDRAAYVVYWIERCCRLYEGDRAGEPLRLIGCHQCDYELPDLSAEDVIGIDGETMPEALETMRERARLHCACVAAGHHIDWQYDATMRMFGWIRHSEQWGRLIRRFRKASVWVAKKNKKSPTLSAWGMYLLMGDGEQGQKVFLAAKDGNQAREIAGKHAIEMLNQSDILAGSCTVNKSTMQITHESTRSILKPLSSANSRSQQSKEGLNGSVLVDETHVVDRAFAYRINRAGISRSEPVFAEFSTAGNNPDAYGKERFDHALKVRDGSATDQTLFVEIHAAPQNLTDDALAADPMKYCRMANPSIGSTVDPEEYLEDYQQSCGSISALAEFKMYRLNVWQQASNPWIRSDDWAKCSMPEMLSPDVVSDLAGIRCWAGVDLSHTRDMSAMVLAFPRGDDVYLMPFFWMPENEAFEKRNMAPFMQWAESGDLLLCKGDTIDQADIHYKIGELAQQFTIAQIRYDKTYAYQLAQSIEDTYGIEPVEFPQTMMHFAGPTAGIEGKIIAGNIRHPAHPILDWQMGHVNVKTDYNMNKRPVKPKFDDHKKIDGVIAAIMAFSGAVAGEATEDWYIPGELGSV